MQRYSVTILGEPISYKAPGHRKNGWSYNPREKEKKRVQEFLKTQHDIIPLDTEIYDVQIFFFFSIPKSYSKKRKQNCFNGYEIPTSKDCDNLMKFYFDCGNKILWHDDRKICKGTFQKSFHAIPRTEIYCTVFNISGVLKFKEMFESLRQVTN